MRIKEDQDDEQDPIRYISTPDVGEKKERYQIRDKHGSREAEKHNFRKLVE
jgi:hypothetical protein